MKPGTLASAMAGVSAELGPDTEFAVWERGTGLTLQRQGLSLTSGPVLGRMLDQVGRILGPDAPLGDYILIGSGARSTVVVRGSANLDAVLLVPTGSVAWEDLAYRVVPMVARVLAMGRP